MSKRYDYRLVSEAQWLQLHSWYASLDLFALGLAFDHCSSPLLILVLVLVLCIFMVHYRIKLLLSLHIGMAADPRSNVM